MKLKTLWTSVGIFLSISLMALGDEASESEFSIGVDKNVYPTAAFERKGVKVSSLEAKSAPFLPDKSSREAAFSKVRGLQQEIQSLDNLERDKLYVSAKIKNLRDLYLQYPKIQPALLKELKAKLQQ